MTTRKTSGPSGHKPPRYVTFTQQLKPEFWLGWDVALILAGDPRKIGEEVLRRYETAGGVAQGLWIIKHDRDVLADGSSKDDHVHVVLQQSAGPNVSGKLQCLAMDQIFGFGSKSVVRASPGRGIHIENALSYLIHAKDPDKYQYSPSEVVTIRGTDYFDIESENRAAWARRAVMARKASVPMREWNELGDALVQKVLDGEVDEVDILRDKTLMDIYTRNESKVNLVLKSRARREMLFEVDKLRAGIFQKTIVWATGASDQGKTYLVESIAAELAARLGWPVFRATAKNGPDDYAGEPIFMMNEPSTKVMEWADFLTLLDPRQAGPISARFYNKPDAAPRVILIAVAVDPVEFGFFIPGKRSTNDSLDQLIRRITLLIEARKDDTGEPRYSVGQVGNVRPYMRTVTIPGQQVYRHDLKRLVRAVEGVATAHGLTLDDAPSTDAGSKAVVRFLTKFAETDRYFNLNRLAQGDSVTIDDPIARWVSLVRAEAPPRRRSPARERQEAMNLSLARHLDENVPLAILDFTSLSGAALNSYEAMTAQTQLDERVAVEGMLLAIRPIRFLSRTIATFDYARGLPVFTEFFDDWMMPDSHLRRRRRFPLHRS